MSLVVPEFGPSGLAQRTQYTRFVPPSAAEPWISRHPALVRTLERMDRALSRPLAPFGDHVLYWFERTDVECGRGGEASPRMGT